MLFAQVQAIAKLLRVTLQGVEDISVTRRLPYQFCYSFHFQNRIRTKQVDAFSSAIVWGLNLAD
jgi:hypothetical protein